MRLSKSKITPISQNTQYGFTLIELMISLVLGLLISAAVMQVFLTSQRVDRVQTAASEIQDKAVFGLQSIEPQVRLANLGNDGVAINDMTAMGGIVLTAGDYDSGNNGGGNNGGGNNGGGNNGGGNNGGGNNGGGNNGGGNNGGGNNGGGNNGGGKGNQKANFQRLNLRTTEFHRASFQISDFQRLVFQRAGFQKVAASSSLGFFNVMVKGGLQDGYLTRSHDMSSTGDSNKWSGLSNTGQPSDQLTIQYINTTGRDLFDCEGEKIEPNAYVITRYFVADGTGTGQKTRKNLNLNCDAGRITSDGVLEDFRDSGATIIENIDQFNIRLGVQQSDVNAAGQLTYQYADMTVKQYMDLPPTSAKPPIVNIRIAILARSTANSPEASADKFTIFGVEQSLKTQTNAPKYLRRVYESNILLRNARIMRIIDTSIT